jgi:IS4 transposase
MILGKVFDRFVQDSPLTVMLRGTLDYALRPEELDDLFHRTAERQYTRELLFSTVVDLMSLVVCRIRPSVHAAYQADPDAVGVTVRALYDKLDHMETGVSAALVHQVADRLIPVIRALRGGVRKPLAGYRVRILDGNHLAATEHRLKELRGLREGALPGHALVVYDPEWMICTDILPCEDAYAQERAVLDQVLPLVGRADVWVGDRNFCTTGFLFGIAQRRAFFVIRQHAQTLTWKRKGRRRYQGRSDTGKVFEQAVELCDESGKILAARRITVQLDKPTRDGDTEIHILTNLPSEDADALTIAELYRGRWTLETAFAEIAKVLENEIATLAYPKAALFGFSVGLVAYNVLGVLKGALRAAHGKQQVAQDVSGYYLAEEVSGTYRGMMIAIPAKHWGVFGRCEAGELAQVLKELAGKVRLAALQKHPRGPKKQTKKKRRIGKSPHVATARLLAKRSKIA